MSQQDSSADIRKTAAWRLTDKTVLASIAQQDSDASVRKTATRKLNYLSSTQIRSGLLTTGLIKSINQHTITLYNMENHSPEDEKSFSINDSVFCFNNHVANPSNSFMIDDYVAILAKGKVAINVLGGSYSLTMKGSMGSFVSQDKMEFISKCL